MDCPTQGLLNEDHYHTQILLSPPDAFKFNLHVLFKLQIIHPHESRHRPRFSPNNDFSTALSVSIVYSNRSTTNLSNNAREIRVHMVFLRHQNPTLLQTCSSHYTYSIISTISSQRTTFFFHYFHLFHSH